MYIITKSVVGFCHALALIANRSAKSKPPLYNMRIVILILSYNETYLRLVYLMKRGPRFFSASLYGFFSYTNELKYN